MFIVQQIAKSDPNRVVRKRTRLVVCSLDHTHDINPTQAIDDCDSCKIGTTSYA